MEANIPSRHPSVRSRKRLLWPRPRHDWIVDYATFLTRILGFHNLRTQGGSGRMSANVREMKAFIMYAILRLYTRLSRFRLPGVLVQSCISIAIFEQHFHPDLPRCLS